MQKHNLQPATTEITNVLKKSCHAAYQQYRTYLDEEKKKSAKDQTDQSKQILDKKIQEVEGKVDQLMESSFKSARQRACRTSERCWKSH